MATFSNLASFLLYAGHRPSPFKQFCIEIFQVFAPDYLRKPTKEELEGILKENAGRGWPGLIGSLDCMHWKWLMCPVGWQGSYKGKESGPTLVLEAVCDKKLWVYHYNFGRPGSNNDLNTLAKNRLYLMILSQVESQLFASR